MKRTETRKQAIRRILLRWFDQRKNAADNKTSNQSGTTANTEIPKADKGKRAVPTDNEKTIADSHKLDMPSRKSTRKTGTRQERLLSANMHKKRQVITVHLLHITATICHSIDVKTKDFSSLRIPDRGSHNLQVAHAPDQCSEYEYVIALPITSAMTLAPSLLGCIPSEIMRLPLFSKAE